MTDPWKAASRSLSALLVGALCALGAGQAQAQPRPGGQMQAQAPAPPPERVAPWGLPPLPQGVGPVELFADIGNTPQGQFLEGGAFDTQGNLWFVAIATGWISYLTPDGRLVPVVNCNPPPELGQTCEPQGTRWYNGKLYLTTRHLGILVYDPQVRKLSTLVNTYRNQLFKGPNDLDFDAEGNLFFTDPWGTGPGPSMGDRTGAVYQYSRDGVLRRLSDTGYFPNGIAVSPDDGTLAVADYSGGRIIYDSFLNGPNPACATCAKDPQHLTFFFSKAGTYVPGNGGPDGIHYDVHGNLWVMLHGMGGIIEVDPKGLIIGFVPIPNGDVQTTNFAFGGPGNQYIYFEGAVSGRFYRFRAPYAGLIGPGGERLPMQP